MPENQAIYNIGKQDAGRDIFNIVIQHLATGKKVILPSIQSVLKKGETDKGDFFRTPPEWVDFEEHCIVERKEVKDIINKLDTDKIQLVLGAPASGKSIILKNVGFWLANKNKNVYMIELKGHPQEDIKSFFENIPTIDNAIFIVDDAHLYLSYCEKLAEEFNKSGKGNLIIGSRDSREITQKHPTEGFEYESLNELRKTCIEITAEDVTEDIIRTFLEKQNFDSDRINTAFKNLLDYKKDLWFLSWALMSYNNSVNMDDIYEKIKYYIEDIRVGKDKEPINAEDVFLPLSMFYRFEIPIERFFLEEELDIDAKLINQLIGLQKIEEIKETKMISLNHSSLAELYFGTYKRYDAFGIRIKRKILNGKDKKHLEYCSFFRYLTTGDLRNTIDVIIALDRDYSNEKGGQTLLRELIDINKIQHSIKIGIERENDLINVGKFVKVIRRESKDVAIKFIDCISARIEKENDLINVGKFISNIAWSDMELVLELFEGILARFKKEEDIRMVGRFVSFIALTHKKVALKIVENIDTNSLSSKINKEKDIGKIGLCLSSIVEIDKEVASRLVENIDTNALSSKINKEEDIENVGWCVFPIARASENVVMKLTESLSTRINKEKDIKKISVFISNINYAHKEVALKLVDSIDIDALSSKIYREVYLFSIIKFMEEIARINKEVALKLVDSVSAKINDEEDIENVGMCVMDIRRANPEVAEKLVEGIDIDSLASKIGKEEDIKKVGVCIYFIVNFLSEQAVIKLVYRISTRIEKEDNIENILECLSEIARASENVAKEIINRLNPKLRDELQKRLPQLY